MLSDEVASTHPRSSSLRCRSRDIHQQEPPFKLPLEDTPHLGDTHKPIQGDTLHSRTLHIHLTLVNSNRAPMEILTERRLQAIPTSIGRWAISTSIDLKNRIASTTRNRAGHEGKAPLRPPALHLRIYTVDILHSAQLMRPLQVL